MKMCSMLNCTTPRSVHFQSPPELDPLTVRIGVLDVVSDTVLSVTQKSSTESCYLLVCSFQLLMQKLLTSMCV